MPNSTVPAADLGLPAHIIPFPTERTRPPAASSRRLDAHEWWRCFSVAWALEPYGDSAAADGAIVAMIAEGSPAGVARLLEESAGALALLRGVVASLAAADRRVAAAADRLLRAEGL